MRGQTVIPIFYDVVPSALRKQKRKCKEASLKHELENKKKVESWRKALMEASNISGWEIKHIANGHESRCIKEIVDTISHRLHPVTSSADKNLIGIAAHMHKFISCLKIGLVGVVMIGILGVGGGGKTTLASSVYDIISSKFDDFCFVENLRKESSKYGLVNLQKKVLSSVLKEKQVHVGRVEEGICVIMGRSCYRYRTVLIVLDDVNHLDQLNLLAGSQDWFGEGSRIITSRDEHSFIEHRVDVIHKIVLIDEVLQLFRMHGLKPIEKRLLVRDERAMVLVAVWIFHRVRSINMWTQKVIIIIWDGKFDIHDLTNFMGRYTVRGKHGNNHEKCCSIWKKESVVNICATDAKVCADMKNRGRIDFKFKQRLDVTGPLPEYFPIWELSCFTMISLVQKQLSEGYKKRGKNDRVERDILERLEKGKNKVKRDALDRMEVVQRETVTLEDRIVNRMERVFHERMDRLEDKMMERMNSLEKRIVEIELGSVVEQDERLTNKLKMEVGVVERMET
ncbi:unnamed protein product [Lactuca virosa]|uniref:TIR domain-containing protein n=1 Tax=Lactuca virosa TaxID=75947 RepID=A0AAU9MZQ1_9ASTR|nr:unnamed protein product [Lactuca virosa]